MMRSVKSLLFVTFALIGSDKIRAEFTPIAGWGQQLFPSYIIATAALKNANDSPDDTILGDADSLLGVQVTAPDDNSTVKVTIESEGYLDLSVYSGVLAQKGKTYSIFPKLRYKFDRLSQCNQATPATITYRVRIDDGVEEEKSTTVTLRPIHDCPIVVANGDSTIDTSFTFATFVNEQHPFMDKLLREALDIGKVDGYTGYQSKTDEEVLRQVYSIWDLMVARDTRYSSITTTAADSTEVFSQHVRLLEDTVNNQQANCVDGSVLMVSLLRKIGIESFLVLVPGHCYVGFFLDEKQDKLLGLETTLIGAELDWPEEVDEVLETAVDESLQSEYSWPSFVAAIEAGTSNLIENAAKLKSDDQSEYKIIDIAAARKAGVLPIPFRGVEKFASFDHSAYIASLEYEDEEDSEWEVDDSDEEEDEEEQE